MSGLGSWEHGELFDEIRNQKKVDLVEEGGKLSFV